MKKTFLIITALALSLSGFSQNDPQAKAILDKVSANGKSYKTISTDFTISETNIQNKDASNQKGSLKIKGEKYQLITPSNETYFDGKTVYNYLPGVKEVNITKPDAKPKNPDDFFISNPKDIFKIYEKNFKYKFIRETTLDGKQVAEIDLYPVDLNKKYSRIRMQIDKTTYKILTVKTFLKDGHQYLITFTNFKVNTEIADSEFSFDTKKHPDAEVIDLRF